MAAFAIVSKKHAEGAKAPVDFNSGKSTIGTGPYKFVEWRREDSLAAAEPLHPPGPLLTH